MAKNTKKVEGFSDEERDAMKERILEIKANKADPEKALLAKIAEMPEPDRTIAKKIHAIVIENAPELSPKTWYGMPAYANKEGKVVCFFQNASKFKYRYSTLGFQEDANLDEGNMWPTSFALSKITPAEEEKITALIKKAAR